MPIASKQPSTEPRNTEPPAACALAASELDDLEVAPALLTSRLFMSYARGGFQVDEGRSIAWYDVHDLASPVSAPGRARIVASSASRLALISPSGQLGFMARGGPPRFSELRLYAEQLVDGPGGRGWALARGQDTRRLVRVEGDGAATVAPLDLEGATDPRLAVTSDGQLVVGWVERDGAALRARVRFGEGPAVTVDEVITTEPVAALSERSHRDLELVPRGRRGVALAWRPITDASYAVSDPPSTPAGAEVRVSLVEPGAPIAPAARFPTRALPLGGTTVL